MFATYLNPKTIPSRNDSIKTREARETAQNLKFYVVLSTKRTVDEPRSTDISIAISDLTAKDCRHTCHELSLWGVSSWLRSVNPGSGSCKGGRLRDRSQGTGRPMSMRTCRATVTAAACSVPPTFYWCLVSSDRKARKQSFSSEWSADTVMVVGTVAEARKQEKHAVLDREGQWWKSGPAQQQ